MQNLFWGAEYRRVASTKIPEEPICSPEHANDNRDLTHAFFESILAKDSLHNLDPDRGLKFRSYLLGAVKHFLSDQRRKSMAEKRGGSETNVSIEASSNHSQMIVKPPDEYFFDHHWACALLNRAMNRLEKTIDTPLLLQELKPWLNGDDPKGASQSQAANRLNMSEGALKVAIHRLRKKLRKCVRSEISQTLESPDEETITGEIDFLIKSLAAKPKY